MNLGDAPAEGHVSLPWDELRGTDWTLADASSGERYERSGDDLRNGLYVSLDPWGWHLFDVAPRGEAIDGPRSTDASPRRRAAPRTICSPRTRGTSGGRT